MEKLGHYYNTHGVLVDPNSSQKVYRSYKNKEGHFRNVEWIAKNILSLIGPARRDSKENYLDFGCNIGLLLDYLKGDFNIYGVELNGTAREFAIQNLGLTNIYPTLDSISPSVKFDLISLCDVIEHVSDPVQMISALKRKLNHGGKIFLRLPVIDGLLFSAKTPWAWKWVYAPYHLSMFSINAIRQMAKACGMEVLVQADARIHCTPEIVSQKLLISLPAFFGRSDSVRGRFVGLTARALARGFSGLLKAKYASECYFVVLSNGVDRQRS